MKMFMEYNMSEIKIEIGKTYEISCMNKKSVYELEYWTDNDNDKNRVKTETMWRNGEWLITPQDEDEVEMLTAAMTQGDSDWFEPQAFQENEFLECWDGCSFDMEILEFDGDEDAREQLEENVYEEGTGYFFDNNWDTVDCEYLFYGPIAVEETEKRVF